MDDELKATRPQSGKKSDKVKAEKKPAPAASKKSPKKSSKKSPKKPSKKPKKTPNKKLIKKGRRTALVAFESLAALLILVLVLAGALAWRLTAGPLDISFAKDYIESALNTEDASHVVTVSSARLHWPDIEGALYLGLGNVNISAADGREVFKVEELALALSKRKLLLAKIAPEIAVLRKSSLHIVRTADGALDFGMEQGDVDTEEARAEAEPYFSGIDIDGIRGQVAVSLDKLSANRNLYPILSQFQGLQIENATVVVEDFKTNASWFFPDFDATFIAQGSSLRHVL